MLLYRIFLFLFSLGIRIAAPWVSKARAWSEGRKRLFEELEAQILPGDRTIWMHCASAGEFEQGKPVAEALRREYPRHKLLVSFFSPSGYGVGKKYPNADIITYLPLDTPSNARRFLDMVRPELVIFIKYDYWYHHLHAARQRGIPLLMVSALFREDQVFFKWYGGFHRKMLSFFTAFFVQDERSVELLKGIRIETAMVSGDTRFDRVAHISETAAPIPLVESFLKGEPVLVAGSTWGEDERLIKEAHVSKEFRLIIAPHEIGEANISRLRNLFTDSVLFSSLSENDHARVLIIDNIGMLSRLYRYATVTYIGGGFNKSGIHNTLEAAAWGKPVVFGPNYKKFREARGLVEAGAALPVRTAGELELALQSFQKNDNAVSAGEAAAAYVSANKGATGRIIQFIQEKRLLTSE